MNITELTTETCTVLALAGRLDTINHGILDTRIADTLGAGSVRLVIDCAELDYVSSTGLRVFLTALKKVKAAKGRLVICSLQDGIREIFDISGFSGLFEVYADRPQALGSF